jgi:hypothetical protein
VQALAGQHHARLDQFLVELAHRGEQFAVGHGAGLGSLRRLDYHHDTHE